MSNIGRRRGHRDDDFNRRVSHVLDGGHDPNPTVVSAAANHLLSPFLKARHANDKGGILSIRQIQRRKGREIPLGDRDVGIFKGRVVEGYSPEESR